MLKKNFIFLIGGKNFVIFRFYKVFKYSIETYTKILPLLKNKKVFFLIKIIQSIFLIIFKPVNPEMKEDFNSKYFFRFPDFFSSNFNIWKSFLIYIPNFKYLEIGTFEGRSALFISEFDNCEKIVCVDPYIDYDQSEKYDFKMSNVFESVSQKFKQVQKKNMKLIREKSDDFFLKNNETFDVIYIDGHHKYDYVKRDFINSMNCLKKNGILICDDFWWLKYEKLNENPIGAILECYDIYKKNLQILFINHQIIFKKK
jgi:hypothetical protein